MTGDFDASSAWLYSPGQLEKCRRRANRQARVFLAQPPADKETRASPPVTCFAAGFADRSGHNEMEDDEDDGPEQSSDGHAFLTPQEEGLLVAFYASKLPSLIGPQAQVPRLRRDIKVAATSALLFRRFFLSNSVMLFDPKAIMVAAAFLGAKAEDATADARYLEEGTKLMNAPVTMAEILPAELSLISGINFDLLCFHPYKAVLAFTEDLRTYLKSDKGKRLAHFFNNGEEEDRPVVGRDLKPMHDGARKIVDDVIVSDIPFLYSPGQVGLAALMVANEELQKNTEVTVPRIDLLGYLEQRFENTNMDTMRDIMKDLCTMLVGLKEGKHGCGNHNVDLQELKGVHKKLKKCRIWGNSTKSKKRKSTGEDGPEAKRTKSA